MMRKKRIGRAEVAVVLLRLKLWGSKERHSFLAGCPPTTLVLPDRPMFSLNNKGKPGTDSPEYSWFVFSSHETYSANPGGFAKIKALRSTPIAERREWTERLRASRDQQLAAEAARAAASVVNDAEVSVSSS